MRGADSAPAGAGRVLFQSGAMELCAFLDAGLRLAQRPLVVVAPAPMVMRPGAAETVLSAEDQARIGRLHRAQDRLEQAAAWVLARLLLGHVAGLAPKRVAVVRDGFGRPAMDHGPGLDFNISHGAGWVAVGLTRFGRIGVDVEGARAPAVWSDVLSAVLRPDQLARWAAQAEGARGPMALRQWCTKEAVLKARGDGLSGDPRTVDVPLWGSHHAVCHGRAQYRIGTHDMTADTCLAFAVTGPQWPDVAIFQ